MPLTVALIDAGRLGGDLAESLAEGVSSQAQVTIVATDLSESLERFRALAGVDVRVIYRGGDSWARRTLNAGMFPIRLRRALRAIEPELTIDTGFSIWSALPRRVFPRSPLAVMVHDPAPHPGWRGRLVDQVISRRWNSADVVISLSESSGQELQQRTSTPVAVTSLGIRHRVIEHAPAEIAQRRKQLLFWGRLEAYKGIDLLAEAYSIAKSVDPELELTIVGRGNLAARTRQQLQSLGAIIDERWIATDEITGFIARAGIMLLPYTSATQSGPAATAISNGIPTVGTDVGALPEQVRHERSGIIVPRDDPAAFAAAIIHITSDEHVARNLSENSLAIRDSEELWEIRGLALISRIAQLTGRMAPLAHCE
jgi:glycosyltransferase involved in cell wall biosynthesis